MCQLLDLATQCIRCGFCLESCPTYLETGSESESPRGRIYLSRNAESGALPWSHDAVGKHLDLCLGCRACEPVCPSGVRYGAILELSRERLQKHRPNRRLRKALKYLTSPFWMKLGLKLPGKNLPKMFTALSSEKPEAAKPRAQREAAWPAISDTSVPPVKGEVYLLEGCAMRVLYPRVHQATRRLLRRVGYTVRGSKSGCCGALHEHQGFTSTAKKMLRKLERSMQDNLPVIVNSAGCGSFMKDHGSEKFSKSVRDVSEFLLEKGLADQLSASPGIEAIATYHDACHLAHGQRIREQPRKLLSAIPNLKIARLPESDMCCGSAGIYNLLQPKMARQLLERKWKNIESTGASALIMGNPGCYAWIEQAAREHGGNVKVLHIAEILEASFSGLPQ